MAKVPPTLRYPRVSNSTASTAWFALSLMASLLPAAAHAASDGCAVLRGQYRVAVEQARVCQPTAREACAALQPAALGDACHCQVRVNPAATAQLERLSAQYRAHGCVPEAAFCNRQCVVPAEQCSGLAGGVPLCGGH